MEAVVQENSRKAAQNTPLRRAQSAVSAWRQRPPATGLPPICAPISSLHGRREWRRGEAAGEAGAVHHGGIEPPAEQVEGDADDRDDHGVLHQRGQVILAPRHADFVGAEADMDEEHQDHGDPVVELREDDVQGCRIQLSSAVPLTSPAPLSLPRKTHSSCESADRRFAGRTATAGRGCSDRMNFGRSGEERSGAADRNGRLGGAVIPIGTRARQSLRALRAHAGVPH